MILILRDYCVICDKIYVCSYFMGVFLISDTCGDHYPLNVFK